MSDRNYWLDLFTGTTWQEFLEAGGKVSGFRESRWKTVQKFKSGDYLLCYITGISRWIGILEVISKPYQDRSPIWKDDDFPCRVKVKEVVTLTLETAVPVLQLKDELTIFKNLKNPRAWSGPFRGSPSKWKESDGKAILRTLLQVKNNPIVRPVDQNKLSRRPKALPAKIGPVTVPGRDQQLEEKHITTKEPSLHLEIQWLLLKLGNDMALDVWVARNDRSKVFNGHRFVDLPRIKEELPLQFDEATNRTIEFIDVLWLQGNAILAAFEIESTTLIYSGLLRMADLIAMQPNLNIPLYIVAPEERKDKVIIEVNRPTFSRLTPPLNEMCRFISFSE